MRAKFINEYRNFNFDNCPVLNINKEIYDYVNKYESDEQLLRSGGIPINILDRAAYGFSSDDIKTIMPKDLHIKWMVDYENVEYEHKYSKLTKKEYANKINIKEPIDVSYSKGKFWIEDGHHRYYAAKILNKPLNINLEIKDNPILKLGQGLDYDDFHRCVFNQVKNKKVNESNISKLNDNFYKWFGKSKVVDEQGNPLVVYHGTTKEFDEFSYKFIGKLGTSRGMGFYFIKDLDKAKMYTEENSSYIYSVYLRIEKPLDSKKKTITKQQLAKFIKTLDPTGEDFLINYYDVYENYNKALNIAIENEFKYNDNDVDLIHSIFNAVGGLSSFDNTSKVLYESLGYDGIIEEYHGSVVYVVFNPNQIKSVDNNGSFNPNSDNIYENHNSNKLYEASIYEINKNDIFNKTFINGIFSESFIEEYIDVYRDNKNINDDIDDETILHSHEYKQFILSLLYDNYNTFLDDFEYNTKWTNDNKLKIYRMMTVDDNFINNLKTKNIKRLGKYWSYDENAAESHWADASKPNELLLVSCIDESNVDWIETIQKNIHPSYTDEKEITLFKNTPIKLLEVYLNYEQVKLDNIILNKIFYS